jgi:hypothetical protein
MDVNDQAEGAVRRALFRRLGGKREVGRIGNG